jgi:Protein of unknown function (DUF3102)
MTRSSKKSPPVKSADLSFEPVNSGACTRGMSDEQLLDIFANTINALRKQASSNLLEMGYRLIEAKLIAGHGNWLPWLDHNFGWTEQTALNYMRLYELNKSKTVLDLDLPHMSMAETKCAKGRRESVPVGLREKGCEARFCSPRHRRHPRLSRA